MDKRCVIYHIDNEGRIVYLSDEWQAFADENQASTLTPNHVLNKHLNDFIADKKCRQLYDLLIDAARTSHRTIQFPYRCDSPAKRRFMNMEITQLDQCTTQLTSCVEREESRETVPLLDSSIERTSEFIVICGMCKKIRISSDEWLEVEKAIERLGLFNAEYLPQLTQSLCYECLERKLGRIKQN
jgi:uncharacterized CHY-type Zn-finger protein